jgi:cation diffusion facilitator CzcD-associated flavoprotein CzcO
VNVPGKSPSVWRVVVIVGAGAVLASAMTPAAQAVTRAKKVTVAKKRPAATASKAAGGGGPQGLDWAINAPLRP